MGHAVDVADLERVVGRRLSSPASSEVPDRCSIEVALDGKTIRGTIPRGHTHGVHLLAAYAATQGVVLCHVRVDSKANELVATPLLLGQLDVTGMLVPGDAMFTQRALSTQIVAAGGDYLWLVKDHQPS